jgi:hypothetical protein
MDFATFWHAMKDEGFAFRRGLRGAQMVEKEVDFCGELEV